MVKIHWSAYIIISIFVLFASYRLNYRTSSRDFTLFIWLGYLFLIIGTAKLGIWFINRKKESAGERKFIKRDVYQRASQQRAARYCIRCGNALRGYENFCPVCGQKLK